MKHSPETAVETSEYAHENWGVMFAEVFHAHNTAAS